jgi:hypothetical protein
MVTVSHVKSGARVMEDRVAGQDQDGEGAMGGAGEDQATFVRVHVTGETNKAIKRLSHS